MAPTGTDEVLRGKRDGAGEHEVLDPVEAPPATVPRAGGTQDERHTVAGEQSAARPHQHVLASEHDGHLDPGTQGDADEYLGDRHLEAQDGLTEDLHRQDHRGDVQAGSFRLVQTTGMRVVLARGARGTRATGRLTDQSLRHTRSSDAQGPTSR